MKKPKELMKEAHIDFEYSDVPVLSGSLVGVYLIEVHTEPNCVPRLKRIVGTVGMDKFLVAEETRKCDSDSNSMDMIKPIKKNKDDEDWMLVYTMVHLTIITIDKLMDMIKPIKKNKDDEDWMLVYTKEEVIHMFYQQYELNKETKS